MVQRGKYKVEKCWEKALLGVSVINHHVAGKRARTDLVLVSSIVQGQMIVVKDLPVVGLGRHPKSSFAQLLLLRQDALSAVAAPFRQRYGKKKKKNQKRSNSGPIKSFGSLRRSPCVIVQNVRCNHGFGAVNHIAVTRLNDLMNDPIVKLGLAVNKRRDRPVHQLAAVVVPHPVVLCAVVQGKDKKKKRKTQKEAFGVKKESIVEF